MTENKLKSMAENNKFEELMNNKQELERLSKIEDISEILDILNKYGYNGTKQDLEQDLFEILQDLSEDDLKNISGGKILNKKYLAGLMGGLTMIGATSLNTSARAETQSTVKTKSATSFLNKVDKTTIGIAGTSLAVGGIFVEALNLMFRKPKIEYRETVVEKKVIEEKIITVTDFALTKEQQKIYNNTKRLSEEILKYVGNYITEHKQMPCHDLTNDNPEHKNILELVRSIRTDWLNMYDNQDKKALTERQKKAVIANQFLFEDETLICDVSLTEKALHYLFCGLPVKNTTMHARVTPEVPEKCADEMEFLQLLSELEQGYTWKFMKLQLQVQAGLHN